jgi:hypothetical protein
MSNDNSSNSKDEGALVFKIAGIIITILAGLVIALAIMVLV